MSDHHFQLPSTVLDPTFQFAQDCFMSSYERFTGDVNAFNRDNNNDFIINQHPTGFIYLWKPGILKKLQRDFGKHITIPLHSITMLSTPAMTNYPFHHEGMGYTSYATENYQQVVRRARRSVNLNYPVTKADLTKSRIEWATPTEKLLELVKAGYKNIVSDAQEQTQEYIQNQKKLRETEHRGSDAYIQSHVSVHAEGMNNDTANILSAMHDSGQGVRIKYHQEMVYEEDPTALAELLTPVDEYYDMTVPTLIRTNQWHRIDNTKNPEQRIMGVLSFDPNYSYFDVTKLVMDNEFIK